MSGPHGAGDVIDGRYEIRSDVGEGGMQFVYAAHDKLIGRMVALKTPKNKSATKRFKRSAIVAAKVNHPNVAKTLDYVRDGTNRYLIEELIEGSDLQDALLHRSGCLDPYSAAKVFHHLAKGVAAAHHAGVVHRDLKPTNVMVVGGYSLNEIKITDFGIAKMANEELIEAAEGGTSTMTTSQTAVGALPYMAPEAIETPRAVGSAADVWSVGAMMFHLLSGAPPFGTGLAAVRRILDGTPPPTPAFLTANPQFASLAKELMDVALQCLQKNPDDRPMADEIVTLCGMLCYSIEPRAEGVIRRIDYGAYGFIETEGPDVFFHTSSVYGPRLVQVGANVIFASYDGGGARRAHPVVVVDAPQA
ncbi:MAG: protein kinase [Zoogloeaceae bacterium]|nr:protein kinase [Zoogloeaceae bacterium]